jgi:hypothetical protein
MGTAKMPLDIPFSVSAFLMADNYNLLAIKFCQTRDYRTVVAKEPIAV